MKYVEKYQRNYSGGMSLHGAHPHWQGSSPGGTRTSESNNGNGAFFFYFSYVIWPSFTQSPSSSSLVPQPTCYFSKSDGDPV